MKRPFARPLRMCVEPCPAAYTPASPTPSSRAQAGLGVEPASVAADVPERDGMLALPSLKMPSKSPQCRMPWTQRSCALRALCAGRPGPGAGECCRGRPRARRGADNPKPHDAPQRHAVPEPHERRLRAVGQRGQSPAGCDRAAQALLLWLPPGAQLPVQRVRLAQLERAPGHGQRNRRLRHCRCAWRLCGGGQRCGCAWLLEADCGELSDAAQTLVRLRSDDDPGSYAIAGVPRVARCVWLPQGARVVLSVCTGRAAGAHTWASASRQAAVPTRDIAGGHTAAGGFRGVGVCGCPRVPGKCCQCTQARQQVHTCSLPEAMRRAATTPALVSK